MIRKTLALLAGAAMAASIGVANAGDIPEIMGSLDVAAYQPLSIETMQQTVGTDTAASAAGASAASTTGAAFASQSTSAYTNPSSSGCCYYYYGPSASSYGSSNASAYPY